MTEQMVHEWQDLEEGPSYVTILVAYQMRCLEGLLQPSISHRAQQICHASVIL